MKQLSSKVHYKNAIKYPESFRNHFQNLTINCIFPTFREKSLILIDFL